MNVESIRVMTPREHRPIFPIYALITKLKPHATNPPNPIRDVFMEHGKNLTAQTLNPTRWPHQSQSGFAYGDLKHHGMYKVCAMFCWRVGGLGK